MPSQQLREISSAYVKATDSLGKPPANRAELLQYMGSEAQTDADAAFKSSNDGQEYVILWGVDYRPIVANGAAPPVMVYEKIGKNGKRFVARFRNVMQMTDEEFQKAPFPPGHEAPK